jgi:site-specific DNA recombinase
MRSHPPRATLPAAPPRAAIYARVSSDQQAERHTIDSQLSDLTAHASQDGHLVHDEMLFVDNGHSGASLVRPALERLRDLVALAAIDIVYVHAPDRLARSYAHQALLIEEFARAGAASAPRPRPGWPSSPFEGWDNPRRRHSALGYLSPVEYERRHEARA